MTKPMLASRLAFRSNAQADAPANGLGDAIAELLLLCEYLCTPLNLFVLVFSLG